MVYHFKDLTKGIDFNHFIDVHSSPFDDINSKNIRFKDVERNEMEFKLKLSTLRIGCNKSDKQLSEIENITKVYELQEEVIKIYNDT